MTKTGSRRLRLTALMTAMVAISAPGPAAAAWQSYTNESLGFSVQFPGEPSEGMGIYRSDLLPEAATHYVTQKDGDSHFVMTVIETGNDVDSALLMGEFEYWMGHAGVLVLSSVSRLNIGMYYGRFLSVDCSDDIVPESINQGVRAHQMLKDAANIVCPNGARMTINMFFTQGRLYVATGIQTGQNAKISGAPGRFVNSFEWEGENAVRAQTHVDWERAAAARATTLRNLENPPAEDGGAQAENEP